MSDFILKSNQITLNNVINNYVFLRKIGVTFLKRDAKYVIDPFISTSALFIDEHTFAMHIGRMWSMTLPT